MNLCVVASTSSSLQLQNFASLLNSDSHHILYQTLPITSKSPWPPPCQSRAEMPGAHSLFFPTASAEHFCHPVSFLPCPKSTVSRPFSSLPTIRAFRDDDLPPLDISKDTFPASSISHRLSRPSSANTSTRPSEGASRPKRVKQDNGGPPGGGRGRDGGDGGGGDGDDGDEDSEFSFAAIFTFLCGTYTFAYSAFVFKDNRPGYGGINVVFSGLGLFLMFCAATLHMCM